MGHSINRYHLVNIWLLYLKRSIWFHLGLSAKPCRWIISFYPNSLYQAAASLTTLCGQLTTQRYTWNMRFKKRTTSSSQTQFPRTRDTWALQIKLRLWRRCSEYIRYITSQVLKWRLSRKEVDFLKTWRTHSMWLKVSKEMRGKIQWTYCRFEGERGDW